MFDFEPYIALIGGVIMTVCGIYATFGLYFLPWMIGRWRKIKHTTWLFWFNLFIMNSIMLVLLGEHTSRNVGLLMGWLICMLYATNARPVENA